MSKLIFASLVALSSFAAAAPDAPPPPPPPGHNQPAACAKVGRELAGVFERHNDMTDRATPVAYKNDTEFTLLDTGAWTYNAFDATGKQTRSAEGCLASSKLGDLRALYTKATWKTTPVIHCMAMTNSFTDYTFHGAAVWNARACNATKLDADSAKAITAITTLIADVTKPSPIETSRGKPVR